jgi:hypothetical protein|tara:strand:- start:414 stop:608 length:195 start_codon:yes stop_codon:yes gene_type:complete
MTQALGIISTAPFIIVLFTFLFYAIFIKGIDDEKEKSNLVKEALLLAIIIYLFIIVTYLTMELM